MDPLRTTGEQSLQVVCPMVDTVIDFSIVASSSARASEAHIPGMGFKLFNHQWRAQGKVVDPLPLSLRLSPFFLDSRKKKEKKLFWLLF